MSLEDQYVLTPAGRRGKLPGTSVSRPGCSLPSPDGKYELSPSGRRTKRLRVEAPAPQPLTPTAQLARSGKLLEPDGAARSTSHPLPDNVICMVAFRLSKVRGA